MSETEWTTNGPYEYRQQECVDADGTSWFELEVRVNSGRVRIHIPKSDQRSKLDARKKAEATCLNLLMRSIAAEMDEQADQQDK